MRSLDEKVLRKDTIDKIFSHLHVLDLSPKLKEKVELAFIALDFRHQISDEVDLFLQSDQAPQMRVQSAFPALPFIHPRGQLELVAGFAVQSYLYFAALGYFVRKGLEIAQCRPIEAILFFGVDFLLEDVQCACEAVFLYRKRFQGS